MKTPLTDALKLHIANARFGFHMPGHRGLYGEFDLTEVPGLDNLHDASNAIYESQQEIARVYGAASTLLSTNGSTGGVLAVLGAVCKEGDCVVVDAGCHRSVFNALKLAGATAERVANEKTVEGITMPADLNCLLEATDRVGAKGVVITRPNYYGVCIGRQALQKFADSLHRKGRFLFVDEAHGAHFPFCDDLPSTALDCGADCVVQSAHKTLPAITQTAMIHFNVESLIKVADVINKQKQYLTSSPSYLLMQSIEAAVAEMDKCGSRKYRSLLDEIYAFSLHISNKTKFKCVCLGDLAEYTLNNTTFEKDGTRLIINVAEYGFSGYAVANALEKLFGIFIEMADEQNLVLICMPGDECAEFGLKYLDDCLIKLHEISLNDVTFLGKFDEKKNYKIEDCVIGKIAACDVAVYPPGSPIIFDGEQITADKVKYLQGMAAKGAFISGLDSTGKIPVRG